MLNGLESIVVQVQTLSIYLVFALYFLPFLRHSGLPEHRFY